MSFFWVNSPRSISSSGSKHMGSFYHRLFHLIITNYWLVYKFWHNCFGMSKRKRPGLIKGKCNKTKLSSEIWPFSTEPLRTWSVWLGQRLMSKIGRVGQALQRLCWTGSSWTFAESWDACHGSGRLGGEKGVWPGLSPPGHHSPHLHGGVCGTRVGYWGCATPGPGPAQLPRLARHLKGQFTAPKFKTKD